MYVTGVGAILLQNPQNSFNVVFVKMSTARDDSTIFFRPQNILWLSTRKML